MPRTRDAYGLYLVHLFASFRLYGADSPRWSNTRIQNRCAINVQGSKHAAVVVAVIAETSSRQGAPTLLLLFPGTTSSLAWTRPASRIGSARVKKAEPKQADERARASGISAGRTGGACGAQNDIHEELTFAQAPSKSKGGRQNGLRRRARVVARILRGHRVYAASSLAGIESASGTSVFFLPAIMPAPRHWLPDASTTTTTTTALVRAVAVLAFFFFLISFVRHLCVPLLSSGSEISEARGMWNDLCWKPWKAMLDGSSPTDGESSVRR